MQPPLLGHVSISGDDLAALLRHLYTWRGRSWAELAEEFGYGKDKQRFMNCAKGITKFSLDDQSDIRSTLNTSLTLSDWNRLKAADPDLYEKFVAPKYPLSNVFYGLYGVQNDQTEFNRLCTGRSRGTYLIIRKGTASELIVAYLLIRSASARSPVPTFYTYRPPSNELPRSVRGVVFQSGPLIYSFGRADIGNGFRSTILQIVHRRNNRADLFGVRMGLQEKPEKPYSYPIYCYQLIKRRSRDEIRALVGKKSVADLEQAKIEGVNDIVRKLRQAATYELGVLCGDDPE